MNKSDLIAILSDKRGIPHRRASCVVDAVFDAISQALVRGERVELRGFGVWKAKRHRARDGRNPRTGEPILVPERRLPFFSAGKDVSELIMRAWQRHQDGASA
jgi:integration host factor subunit beta